MIMSLSHQTTVGSQKGARLILQWKLVPLVEVVTEEVVTEVVTEEVVTEEVVTEEVVTEEVVIEEVVTEEVDLYTMEIRISSFLQIPTRLAVGLDNLTAILRPPGFCILHLNHDSTH